jgi:hypothetical protein
MANSENNKVQLMDRSDLVQRMPHQLSAVDFMELAGDKETFSEADATKIFIAAERIALPGMSKLRDAVEAGASVMCANNLKHREVDHRAVNKETKEVLVLRNKNGVGTIELLENLGSGIFRDKSYALQHYTLDLDAAELIGRHFLSACAAEIRKEEQRIEAEQQRTVTLDEMIKDLPRALTIGQLLEIIGNQRVFTALAAEDVFKKANKILEGNQE